MSGASHAVRFVRTALLLCALLVGAAVPLAAQQDPSRELQESQRRLEQIRRERAQLREEMKTIRSRVHDMASELELLDRQVSTSASAIAELEFQMAQYEEQIRQTTEGLEMAQERLARRKSVLHHRLRTIYKRGPLHTAQVLLTADSFGDLLNRYKYLFLIARHDRRLVHEVAALEAQLAARERILQHSILQLEAVREERESTHAELAELRSRQQRALSGVRQRERTTAQRIAQLERDEKRLASLISTLEARRREAERRRAAAGGGATGAGSLTTRDLGTLGWPVEGRLLYRFGRQPQPNGTTLRWNGVGIAAPAGTGVRAVESGTVVMAGPFEGYGPTVVLSHGGGYYSLYLYLRDVSVKEGAQVTRGQVLGSVGGERTPEGAHIEFQIRAPGGEAVDPLTWLRKRAGT